MFIFATWLPGQRLIAGLVFAGLLLGGCVLPQAGQATEAATEVEPIPLRMVLLPFLSGGAFFIAEEEGYFVEQGLEMEYVQLESGSQAIPALLQGEIDVIWSVVNPGILNAIERGGKGRIVASITYWREDGCAYSGVLARPGAFTREQLADLSHFEGLRMAANVIDMSGYYVDKWLTTGGSSIDELQVEDLPAPNLGEALASGNVALVQTSEPWITRLTRNQQGELLVDASEVMPNAQFTVLTFGPGILQSNPEAGQRFMLAYLKAVRQLNEGKTPRNIEN
jgi:NitT/TauT family transport system substrate-binding protein